jgi:hypothetical protein
MIHIELNKEGNKRTTYDDLNARIYKEEYKCNGCAIWLDEQEVIWADKEGNLDTINGLAWCDSCLPFNEK